MAAAKYNASSFLDDDLSEPEWMRNFTPSSTQKSRDAIVLTSSSSSPQQRISPPAKPKTLKVLEGSSALDGVEADETDFPEDAANPDAHGVLEVVTSKSVERDAVLMCCNDADGNESGGMVELSGDIGAIGRVLVDGIHVKIDMKGIIYNTQTVNTNTMAILSVGEKSGKITAMFSDALILHSEGNEPQREKLVQGSLDFDFVGSGDEIENESPKNNEGAISRRKKKVVNSEEQAKQHAAQMKKLLPKAKASVGKSKPKGRSKTGSKNAQSKRKSKKA